MKEKRIREIKEIPPKDYLLNPARVLPFRARYPGDDQGFYPAEVYQRIEEKKFSITIVVRPIRTELTIRSPKGKLEITDKEGLGINEYINYIETMGIKVEFKPGQVLRNWRGQIMEVKEVLPDYYLGVGGERLPKALAEEWTIISGRFETELRRFKEDTTGNMGLEEWIRYLKKILLTELLEEIDNDGMFNLLKY